MDQTDVEMNFSVQLALIVSFAVQCFGKLLHCSEIKQEVCSNTQDYVSSISPDPLPTQVCGEIFSLHDLFLSFNAAL